MNDKVLADTLELMASEIAALKRQIGELQQRERVDSNSFLKPNTAISVSSVSSSGNIAASGKVTASNLTGWQGWTPTQTGWSSVSYLSAYWCQTGNMVTCVINIAGASNSALAELSLPKQAASLGLQFRGTWGWAMDNDVQIASSGAWFINNGSSTVKFFKTMVDASVWTAANSKRIYAVFQYPV